MPGLTLPDLNVGWGAPVSGEPWNLPVSSVRGNGVIKLIDNLEVGRVNRLERLSLHFDVPCPDEENTADDGTHRIAFPARRQEATPWREWRPFDMDMTQLAVPHEEAFVALHSIFAYFGATHCPVDEEIIQMQWHRFARAVWDIVEDPAHDEADRVLAVASWGKEYLPDEVFDYPWWMGRWNWYPPVPREVEYVDEENESEFEFGEDFDGLPVPEGTFPVRPWANWGEDGVGAAGWGQFTA